MEKMPFQVKLYCIYFQLLWVMCLQLTLYRTLHQDLKDPILSWTSPVYC